MGRNRSQGVALGCVSAPLQGEQSGRCAANRQCFPIPPILSWTHQWSPGDETDIVWNVGQAGPARETVREPLVAEEQVP